MKRGWRTSWIHQKCTHAHAHTFFYSLKPCTPPSLSIVHSCSLTSCYIFLHLSLYPPLYVCIYTLSLPLSLSLSMHTHKQSLYLIQAVSGASAFMGASLAPSCLNRLPVAASSRRPTLEGPKMVDITVQVCVCAASETEPRYAACVTSQRENTLQNCFSKLSSA